MYVFMGKALPEEPALIGMAVSQNLSATGVSVSQQYVKSRETIVPFDFLNVRPHLCVFADSFCKQQFFAMLVMLGFFFFGQMQSISFCRSL